MEKLMPSSSAAAVEQSIWRERATGLRPEESFGTWRHDRGCALPLAEAAPRASAAPPDALALPGTLSCSPLTPAFQVAVD
eukprot:3775957-Prymnesium_polylepis.1